MRAPSPLLRASRRGRSGFLTGKLVLQPKGNWIPEKRQRPLNHFLQLEAAHSLPPHTIPPKKSHPKLRH